MSKLAIYTPKGKAQEYSFFASNFYNGCEGDCSYCFLKEFPFSINWSTKPTLKATLINPKEAIRIFEKELMANLIELQKHGLFFNFSSDPFLKATQQLTLQAAILCNNHDIPCKFLTKQAEWTNNSHLLRVVTWNPQSSVGFTLTGRDEHEPGCAPNRQRIKAMKKLFNGGVITYASIEPIIDFGSSEAMISQTKHFCTHYKIGLQSHKKHKPEEIRVFMNKVNIHLSFSNVDPVPTVYWKDGLLKQAGVTRNELPQNCVGRDFKYWEREMK